MAKFQPTGEEVSTIIEKVKSNKKREDAYIFLDLFQDVTGEEAVVWHPGIIGFGVYHYQYDSGHEGDAPLLAFAPRQSRFSLYLESDFPEKEDLLGKLGKHEKAVGCVYVNKLADVDMDVLKELLEKSLEATKSRAELVDY